MQTLAPQSIFSREDGQTMAEYAVVLGTIVLACITIIGLLSGAILSRFDSVLTTIQDMLP